MIMTNWMAALLADAGAAAEPFSLTWAGWAVMLLSNGVVLAMSAFCLRRVLSLPPMEVEETLKGPLEIDPGDADED